MVVISSDSSSSGSAAAIERDTSNNEASVLSESVTGSSYEEPCADSDSDYEMEVSGN